MNQLPPDALATVFSHLDAGSCLRYRGVCRLWNEVSGVGCASVSVKYGALDSCNGIGSVTLVGHEQQQPDEGTGICQKADGSTVSRGVKRVCGRLPRPIVIAEDGEGQKPMSITFGSDLLRDFEFHRCRSDALREGYVLNLTSKTRRRDRAAIRVENTGLARNFHSLDLEACSFEEAARASAGRGDGPIFDDLVETTKPRLLRRALEELDLGGLRRLTRLSVRGCASLRVLRLPPTLAALDASGCTKLELVAVPGGTRSGLVSLNLNGCRSIRPRRSRRRALSPEEKALFGPSTEKALESVQDLDVSAVPGEAASHCPVFCGALRTSASLVRLSFRYSAADAALLALAESASARRTLRFLDVAFSVDLTVAAVEELARRARVLERVNMRGCRRISADCYNVIPILLENRRRGVGDGAPFTLDRLRGRNQKRRKGDNLFYFCQEK